MVDSVLSSQWSTLVGGGVRRVTNHSVVGFRADRDWLLEFSVDDPELEVRPGREDMVWLIDTRKRQKDKNDNRADQYRSKQYEC